MIEFIKEKLIKKPILILSIIVSFVQTLFGLYLDRYIFASVAIFSVRYIIFRFILFIFLNFIWYYLFVFIKHIKNKEKNYYCYLIVFLCCFVTYSIIMLLLWPGNWIGDEKWIIATAIHLDFNTWQHFITSLFYILSLMIFPSPVIIVIIQYTIISAIISYCIGELYKNFGRVSLLIGFLFLFPSIIAHVFYPMRLILFGFIELLFLFIIYNKRNDEKISVKTLVFLSILNIVLSVWRTETIFFVVFLPMILLVRKYSKKTLLFFSVLIILSSGTLIMFQNAMINNEGKKVEYNVTGINYPFTYLLKEEYKNDKDSELIKHINTYINVEKAITFYNGDRAFWDGNVFENIKTDTQFKIFLSDFIELVKKNPKAFIQERFSTFHKTTYTIYYNGTIKYGNISLIMFNFDSYIKTLPINASLRSNVINLLNANSNNSIINRIVLISYNLYIPIIMIIIMWLFSLTRIRKNNLVLFLISSFLLAQTLLVFITAPGSRFMYYFPVFVCGYFLFYTCLLDYLHEKNNAK